MRAAPTIYMSAIKDGRYMIELGGKKRGLLFSLNALDEVQDKFGGYDKLGEVFIQDNKDWIKNTRWLFTLLVNEGREENEPEVTEQQVGRWIHMGNIKEVQEAILKAFTTGTRGTTEPVAADEDEPGEDNDGTDEGNAKGGQA